MALPFVLWTTLKVISRLNYCICASYQAENTNPIETILWADRKRTAFCWSCLSDETAFDLYYKMEVITWRKDSMTQIHVSPFSSMVNLKDVNNKMVYLTLRATCRELLILILLLIWMPIACSHWSMAGDLHLLVWPWCLCFCRMEELDMSCKYYILQFFLCIFWISCE